MSNMPAKKIITSLVVAIIGDKGGIGKSTLGCNLLRRVIEDEKLAVLVDCDSDQHSSAKLSLRREKNEVNPALNIISVKSKNLEEAIIELSTKFKIIIIEFGKAVGDVEEDERLEAVRLATKLAHKIAMPLQPTSFDVETIIEIEKRLLDLNLDKIPALIIPNRVMSKKQLAPLIFSAPHLKYFRLSKFYMENRICYQEVHDTGKTIFDLTPKTKSEVKALEESENIYKEIFYDK